MKFDLSNSKVSNQQAIVGLIVLICWAAVGYYYVSLRPKLVRWNTMGSRAAQVRANIKEIEAGKENIALLEQEADELRAKIREYGKKLPVEEEIPALLENLSRVATSCKVKILEITPMGSLAAGEGKKVRSSFREIPILIKARSGYYELVSFIQQLEQGKRLVKINDLEIKGSKDNVLMHDVELEISVFASKKGLQTNEKTGA